MDVARVWPPGRAPEHCGRVRNHRKGKPVTSFVLVMVSAMMLAAPGSSVTGMNGREDAEDADGVTAEGVTASSEEII